MVPAASLVAMFLTLLLSFFLPIVAVLYSYQKYRFSLKALLAGAVVFLLFQVTLRIPLLFLFSTRPWFAELYYNYPFFSAFIIGGLSAGLFEECGRYLGFRFILQRELSWENGLAYGLGHGGIESIILVGFSYINNILFSLMINRGLFEQFAAPHLGADASRIKLQLVSLPAHIFVAAGVERVLTLIIQVALSLLVLYAVKRKNPLFLLAAILLHTILNAGAVYLQAAAVNIWLIELFITAFAAVAFYLVIGMRRHIDSPGAA